MVAISMGLCEAHSLVFEGGVHPRDWALLKSMGVAAAIGAGLLILGRNAGHHIMRKEAIAIVGLGWIVSTAVGALPFMLCVPGIDPAGAFFESASGFTTTGATVIPDLDKFPRSILLWRATSHWLGGMGILVLLVALLSTFGTGSKSLMRHESSAQSGYGADSRIRKTALRLWQIYTALTIVCIIGLVLLGMSLYDAVVHAFAAISTGGFSSRNSSIAYYNSPAIDAWLCVFMLLGGASFPLMAWMLSGRFEKARRDEELRLYLGIVLVATVVIAADLILRQGEHLLRALQLASFQVISIMTTTGFVTADYALWPTLSTAILVLLMFVGGCSGSTSGGIKVSRIAIFSKSANQQLLGSFRPSQHRPVRMNGEILKEPVVNAALFFVALTTAIVALGTLMITLLEPQLDLLSCFTSVAATLFNVGPGLGAVGPVYNFGFFSPASKFVFSFLMILGRLEYFGLLALLLPSLWRRY